MNLEYKNAKNKQWSLRKNLRKEKKKKTFNGEPKKRELIEKDDGTDYAYVEKLLGSRRCTVRVTDGSSKLCIISRRFKRKVWVSAGDTLLVTIRNYEDAKCDMLHRYDKSEITELIKRFEIPPSFAAAEKTKEFEGFQIEEGDEVDEEDILNKVPPQPDRNYDMTNNLDDMIDGI